MKKIVLSVLFVFAGVFYQQVKAQTIAGHLRFSKQNWEFDKKNVLAELLEFDKQEGLAFWPVYDEYMKQWCQLINDRLARLNSYSESIRDDASSASTHFTDEIFASDKQLNRLQKKTYKKIRKILSAEKAGRFMQLEYTFQLSLLSEMQQRAMLLGDVSRKL